MDKTAQYTERINKVVDYIESNMEEKLTLDTLAHLAGLSKYHFHRIFQAFTDETLYSFINRLRVERAAALLLTQKKTITEIAFSCGFNDSATFSRAFKKHFNISARDWKKKNNSNKGQDLKTKIVHTPIIDINKKRIIKTIAVEEKEFPRSYIAYIRHTGAYAGNAGLFYTLHKKLKHWARSAGLLNYPATRDIIIYHDPKGITEEESLRVSIGITVSNDVSVKGEIGKLCIEGDRYIFCKYTLRNDDYGKAWKQVYREILPGKDCNRVTVTVLKCIPIIATIKKMIQPLLIFAFQLNKCNRRF